MTDDGRRVEHVELPRPGRLLRTLAWNLAESLGLPAVVYAVGSAVAGRNGAMVAATVVVVIVAVVRRLLTGSTPGLVLVSALVMSVQTAVVVGTGNPLIFMLHFPLANLVLAVAFARTAWTAKPLVAQLAAEIVGLRRPSTEHPGLDRFFRGATWLWAGIFLLKTIGFSILMLATPLTLFLVLMSTITIGVVVVGAACCGLWFALVLRSSGLRLRFA